MELEPVGDPIQIRNEMEEMPIPIQEILEEFKDVFAKSTTLPPKRVVDHRINMTIDVAPVDVRPYKCSHTQKDEIEKLVIEMMTAGIIRPSCSPYSSPVLLVKKKDEGWRFCVDYRRLNQATILDKFPIPIIEET